MPRAWLRRRHLTDLKNATCRNTLQGPFFVTDEEGFSCSVDALERGCCPQLRSEQVGREKGARMWPRLLAQAEGCASCSINAAGALSITAAMNTTPASPAASTRSTWTCAFASSAT